MRTCFFIRQPSLVALVWCWVGLMLLWSSGFLPGAESPGTVVDRLVDFQQYRFGLPPKEFDYDATGRHGPVLAAGRPMWRAYADLVAPSPKLVLIQSAALAEEGHYPVALVRDASVRTPRLAVSFKLLSGEMARSAGLIWSARDRNNYYAVLVDGLDHELCLLRMSGGRALELIRKRAMFKAEVWNELEISPTDNGLSVWLNDKLVLEALDQVLGAPGRVGLISHADTIVLFDDFYIQSGEGRVRRKAGFEQNKTGLPR